MMLSLLPRLAGSDAGSGSRPHESSSVVERGQARALPQRPTRLELGQQCAVPPREKASGRRWDPQQAVPDLGWGSGTPMGEARRSWMSTRNQTSGARMSPSVSKGDILIS